MPVINPRVILSSEFGGHTGLMEGTALMDATARCGEPGCTVLVGESLLQRCGKHRTMTALQPFVSEWSDQLSTVEFGTIFGVNRKSVERWIKWGHVVATQTGPRGRYFIDPAQLMEIQGYWDGHKRFPGPNSRIGAKGADSLSSAQATTGKEARPTPVRGPPQPQATEPKEEVDALGDWKPLV